MKALDRYLTSFDLRVHLLVALVLGFAFRLAAAYFVFGAQALDDYRHGVLPAYQNYAGLESTLPDYRSPLIVWMLSGWLKMGANIGIDQPVEQIRWMYMALGTLSLSGLFGVYFYFRSQTQLRAAALGMYLVAIYGLMPFVSTRAFGETVAIAFLLLGIGLLHNATSSTVFDRHGFSAPLAFAGFIFIGLATLFRFQVGVVFVFLGILTFTWWRSRALFLAALIAGLVTLALQIGIDLAADRGPLGTLLAYLSINQSGAAEYGVHPWYSTWLTLLGFTLFPLSLPLLARAGDLFKEHLPLVLSILVFTLVHSLIPHKEERFMFPVLGLVLVAMAVLWGKYWHRPFISRFFTPVFIVLNFVLLIATSFSNSQASEIQPMAAVEGQFAKLKVIDLKSLLGQSWVRQYYLRPPTKLLHWPTDTGSLQSHLKSLPPTSTNAGYLFVTSESHLAQSIGATIKEFFPGECQPTQVATSPTDQLIYKLNPKRNQRRRPSWYWICEPKK